MFNLEFFRWRAFYSDGHLQFRAHEFVCYKCVQKTGREVLPEEFVVGSIMVYNKGYDCCDSKCICCGKHILEGEELYLTVEV